MKRSVLLFFFFLFCLAEAALLAAPRDPLVPFVGIFIPGTSIPPFLVLTEIGDGSVSKGHLLKINGRQRLFVTGNDFTFGGAW
jgi:hypothetical protein